MFLLADYCKNSGILQTIYIFKCIFNIICILAPIFIILSGMKTLFKVITSDEDLKNSIKSIIIKVVIGAFIFFIPSIATTVIKYANPGDFSCLSEATIEKIDYYKELEVKETNKKIADKEKEKEKNIQKTKEQEKKNKEKAKQLEEENRKDREKESAKNNTQIPNTNTNINNGQNTGNYTGTLYVGDSRTVGMYFSLYSGSYSSSINSTYGSEKWYAKVGAGYNWFKSSAIPYIKSYVASGNYIVTIQMGANDLYSSSLATSYVSLINELAASYPNSRFIVISVNPIDDNKASSYGYTATNAQVINFNNTYVNSVSNTSVSYCNTYSGIINNYSATDGIHYNNTTYKNIYNLIKSCL